MRADQLLYPDKVDTTGFEPAISDFTSALFLPPRLCTAKVILSYRVRGCRLSGCHVQANDVAKEGSEGDVVGNFAAKSGAILDLLRSITEVARRSGTRRGLLEACERVDCAQLRTNLIGALGLGEH